MSVKLDIGQIKFFIEEYGKSPVYFDELTSGYAAIHDIIMDLMMRMEKKSGSRYDIIVEGYFGVSELSEKLKKVQTL